MNKAHEKLATYIAAHPKETYSSIAMKLGVSGPTVTRIAQEAGLPPRSSKRITMADVETLEAK